MERNHHGACGRKGFGAAREGLGTSEKGLGLGLRQASGLKRSSLYLQNSEFRIEVAKSEWVTRSLGVGQAREPLPHPPAVTRDRALITPSPFPCLSSQGLRVKTAVGGAEGLRGGKWSL